MQIRSPGSSGFSEDARSRLQERLALFFMVSFLLTGGFLAVTVLVNGPRALFEPSVASVNRMHALSVGVALAGWLALRSGKRALLLLEITDVVVTVAFCAIFAAMTTMGDPRFRIEMIMMLAITHVLVARASVVPSSSARTLVIGLLAGVAQTAATWVLRAGTADHFPPPFEQTIYIGAWCGALVLTTTVTSRVIYGLHQQVREAARIGQYTLGQKLGEGGMGVVYKATHAMLRRATAIKMLPPEKAGESNMARFEREVQLTSELTHPNTIAIYDYGRTPDGIFYYAMEYLNGLTLQQLVEKDGPQDPARVVHILRQICGALDEAHGVGLIHRDIKPANVILCRRGGIADVAKVVDFGLVKDVRGTSDLALSTLDTITGTPQYLAPESLTAPETVDGRSDLYAVGAVGYFLLCGHDVFQGRTLIEVLSDHLHSKPVSPSERLGRPVHPALESLILACLAKKQADRPNTAHDLEEALSKIDLGAVWSPARARAWWKEHGEALIEKPVAPSVPDGPVACLCPRTGLQVFRRTVRPPVAQA